LHLPTGNPFAAENEPSVSFFFFVSILERGTGVSLVLLILVGGIVLEIDS